MRALEVKIIPYHKGFKADLRESPFIVNRLGLFKGSELVCFMDFTTTFNPVYQELYSKELLNLWSIEDIEPETLNMLFNESIKAFSLTDFYVDTDLISLPKNIFVKGSIVENIYEWVNPEVTFYTYKITANDSDKYYFGVSHVNKGNASIHDCINDGYYGSGGKGDTRNKFVNWKRKHSRTLVKTVIKTFERKAPAFKHEHELVGDLYATDPNCLNSTSGGKLSGSPVLLRVNISTCVIHGETSFIGSKCQKCVSGKVYSVKGCLKHGETKHRNNDCMKCVTLSTISFKDCEVHGLSKHQGSACYKCRNHGRITFKTCVKHGEVKHIGDKCCSCAVKTTWALNDCLKHGVTRHVKDVCEKCVKDEHDLITCSKHGETTHRGGKCGKCTAEKAFKFKKCQQHGVTLFQKYKCCKCATQNQLTVKTCVIHGETKHRGSTCSTCVTLKSTHTRFHTVKIDENCKYCIEKVDRTLS